MARFRVEVDKNVCQGFGACVELCPRFFELLTVDGKTTIEGGKDVMKKNEVVAQTLELDDLECIREAAEACPFVAIHIVDLETEEQLI